MAKLSKTAVTALVRDRERRKHYGDRERRKHYWPCNDGLVHVLIRTDDDDDGLAGGPWPGDWKWACSNDTPTRDFDLDEQPMPTCVGCAAKEPP